MKNNSENLLPSPEGVHREFILLDKENFIRDFEINLIQYVDQKRILDSLKETDNSIDFIKRYNIVDLEKEFIEKTGKYLIEQNKTDTEVDYKKSEEKWKAYSQAKKIPELELLEALTERDNPTQQQVDIDLDFNLHFSSSFDKENDKNWLSRHRRISSFNGKIHYLTLRSHRIGYNASFTDEVEFNKIKEKPDTETMINGRFSKPQKFIILKELGIIDFLRQKYPRLSENGLGKILMDITGDSNYQDKLNGHTNKSSNDPYNNEKAVEELRQHLIINRKIDLEKG